MPTIRSLFKSELNRPIEKVITYQNRSEIQIKAEVSEYVVTDHIAENFERLLKLMQGALQGGGGHEIGVWVSGFYGSGKSSFTKYLGFALNRQMKVGDETFLQLLQHQINTPNALQVKAMFNQVSATYDSEVIFLDLASEMLAGASMEDVSTVMFLKVLQWAGYSEDLKVAELERMLEKDGRLDAFHKRAAEELEGIPWMEAHNQPLVANPVAARLAAEFYPTAFKKPEDFQHMTLNVMQSELTRVREMVEIVRRKSGKKNIIFIVDEVGQYVSAKPSLILNLDGLAKNLKDIGGGQVWFFATAQQTLTEDNPTAMLNAPGLYKLKDRFPIQINLEASDIREICHKRLLTKSGEGEKTLGKLFDDCGPQLRTATQLKDAGVYEAPLDKRTFINLYPFLPAHFEILLQLLGRLARKTGGLGLRSAIKVLQDVLVERGGKKSGEKALADVEVNALANTVTFYDSLRRDILSNYGYIVEGVERVGDRFPSKKLHLDVAKSIAVLQILGNLPVTSGNIAALLQPSVDAPSLSEDVRKVIDEMLKDSHIPMGEKNGELRFLTQAAITLQKEFDTIEYRQADVRAEVNNALRGLFKPLPSARIAGVRPVSAGVKVVIGGSQSVSLEGEREPIQFHVEFTPSSAYEPTRTERENDSRSPKELTAIYLLGRNDPDAEKLAITLLRCRKFIESHRNASDPEAQEFVRIVAERLDRNLRDLESKLRNALHAGSFVAHGAHRPVSELSPDLGEACKIFLGTAAATIFERYAEAPFQADGSVAEKFLKTPIDRTTANEDPLQTVTRAGGQARVKTDHKALMSIKDYLGQSGQVEGRRLLEHFSEPRFGWSKDTTRYLLAVLFVGGEIKLRIAGQDHSVKNDDTLAALSSNKALGPVGISMRIERPLPEALDRASDRLRDLTGEDVHPLEDVIAAMAKRHFPVFQQNYSALAEELRNLRLPGAERADDLANDLSEVMRGDGSDAVLRLGGADSPLFDSLKWARKVRQSFGQGLKQTVASLQQLTTELHLLPATGIPGKLRIAAAERLSQVTDVLEKEAFFDDAATLNQSKHELEKLVASAVADLVKEHDHRRDSELSVWQSLPEWFDLNPDDRNSITTQTQELAVSVEPTLPGLRQLLSASYDLNGRLTSLKEEVLRLSAKRREESERPQPEPEPGEGQPPKPEPVKDQPLLIPRAFDRVEAIEEFIKMLEKLRERLHTGERIRYVSQILSESSANRTPPPYQ